MKVIPDTVKQQLFWRFVSVGTISTTIDFSLLFYLQHIGFPVIIANTISTATAFCFSFFANKRFTFKTKGTSLRREMLLFVIVTLSGVWILQNLVIAITLPLIKLFFAHTLALFGAKIIATGCSMVWNFILYKNVVFRHSPAEQKEIEKRDQ